MPRYHFPMDPNCPVWNEQVSSLLDDPMTSAMGAPVDDILEGWEKKHRVNCKRCQEYGAANVGVE